MSISEEQYQLIVKHIDQTLSDQEQQQFDLQVTESEAFRKELEQMQVLIAGVKAVEKAEEIAHIKDAFATFDQERKPVQKRSRRKLFQLGVAASVILMVCLAYFLRYAAAPDPVAIYDHYYEVFPASAETRSGKRSLEALRSYENGQYKAAIPLMEALVQDSIDAVFPIYLANAYLQVDDPENAILVLEKGYSASDTAYSTQYYRWYLGLAWLKAGDQRRAREVFTRLSQQEGIYRQESKEILEQLR